MASPSPSDSFDIVVVGGGMAGLSIAAELAAHGSVLVLEAEDAPGYHATGRSVAFWTESYGGPVVQPLTAASGPWLLDPDPGFSPVPLVGPRGALHLAGVSNSCRVSPFVRTFGTLGVAMQVLDRPALAAQIPGLRAEWTTGVWEPSCLDIDAAALLDAWRRRFLGRGGTLRCGATLAAARRDDAGWSLRTAAGDRIAAGLLVNAAGAWADGVAALAGAAPLGIAPLRRTVVQLRTDPPAPADLPLVLDLAGGFYFKPVPGGRLWLSPHDEVPDTPGDAAPDELAVATAIDRLARVVDWRVAAVERRWAGLRSFAPDRAPVYGFDGRVPGFFWFAGQGGFGIQTAPAAASLGAALATATALPSIVGHIDPAPYRPGRFVRS